MIKTNVGANRDLISANLNVAGLRIFVGFAASRGHCESRPTLTRFSIATSVILEAVQVGIAGHEALDVVGAGVPVVQLRLAFAIEQLRMKLGRIMGTLETFLYELTHLVAQFAPTLSRLAELILAVAIVGVGARIALSAHQGRQDDDEGSEYKVDGGHGLRQMSRRIPQNWPNPVHLLPFRLELSPFFFCVGLVTNANDGSFLLSASHERRSRFANFEAPSTASRIRIAHPARARDNHALWVGTRLTLNQIRIG